MPGPPRTPHRKDALNQTYADAVVDYLLDESRRLDADAAKLSDVAKLANSENRTTVNPMEVLHEIDSRLEGFDPETEVGAHVIALLVATRQAIMGLQPAQTDDRSDVASWTNPFNADTPAAAEGRLEAISRIEQTARSLGQLVAMQEIDRGNVSQRGAARLLGVAQMTINRWYRAHREKHVNQSGVVHEAVTRRK